MSTDWPASTARVVLAEIDSTNAHAARRAPDMAGPEWILALAQTQARGRRGRKWLNPGGNFSATYLTRPSDPLPRVALRSFVAALALFDTFVAVSGRPEGLALKWPNDVLLNGGKVAGILLESNGRGGKIDYLAIGIGVNLVQAPDIGDVEPQALRPVSLLSETGVRVSPEEFLDILAPAYERWEQQFLTMGFDPIRTAWLARAARLGDVITARTDKTAVTGTFQTVDAEGNLILSTAKGRVAIAAAEIYF